MTNLPIDPIDLTRELVHMPSESSLPIQTNSESPEHEVCAYLTTICHQAGIKYELQEALPNRQNLIAYFPSPGRPKLLIMAHMDTVSAGKMEAPFAGDIRDNKLWGRGACDDKGPLAAAFCSLLTLHQQKAELAYDVTFVATVNEECGMSGAKALKEIIEPFDLCLGFEPTGLEIVHAHKGVYRCRISTKGAAAHSSEPEKGRNAIIGMYDIMTDLQMLEFRLRRHPDKELGRASLAITQIQGGSSINIIPDHCEISVDIRLLPNQSPREMAGRVREIVGGRGEVTDLFEARGIKTDMESDHIKSFQQILRESGYDAPPANASYATDCAQVSHLGPCIIWGPGSIEQAHQTEEFIEIKQLQKAYEIMKKFLASPKS